MTKFLIHKFIPRDAKQNAKDRQRYGVLSGIVGIKSLKTNSETTTAASETTTQKTTSAALAEATTEQTTK